VAKVRVYELAKEFGVESKTVIAQLREMGEVVRSASSTVEAPVVRRLIEAFRSAQAPGLPQALESPAYHAAIAEPSHPEQPAVRNSISSEKKLIAAIAPDGQEPVSPSAHEARARDHLTTPSDEMLLLYSWGVLQHLAPDPGHAVAFLAGTKRPTSVHH
jgi:hypothetical protein